MLTIQEKGTALDRYREAGLRLAQHVSNIDRIRKDPDLIAGRTPADDAARDQMLATALADFRTAEAEFVADIDRDLRRPVDVTEQLAEVEG